MAGTKVPDFPFPGAGGETLEIAFGAIKLNSRLHFLVSLLYSGRQLKTTIRLLQTVETFGER